MEGRDVGGQATGCKQREGSSTIALHTHLLKGCQACWIAKLAETCGLQSDPRHTTDLYKTHNQTQSLR